MAKLSVLPFLFILLWNLAVFVRSENCEIRSELQGQITDSRSSGSYCWKIKVPPNSFLRLDFMNLQMSQDCNYVYLKINVSQTGDEYKLCGSIINKNPIITLNEVTITSTVTNHWSYQLNLNLKYTIQDIECANNGSFRCSPHTCVPKYQVCDGVPNCENGADEIGCEFGILAIEGVSEARKSAISWLKSKHTSTRGWAENTVRAVVALELASGANFNGSDIEGELMAKQAELQTAVGFLRSSLSNNELSMILNSLLVTCHNPRRFYGIDIVKRLKTQVEQTTNFTHPIVYLALCNANESWPYKADEDLTDILTSDSNYPFANDIQAMAVMALSCVKKHKNQHRSSQNSTLSDLYQEKIKQFKQLQQKDGSFGNVYTTALIAQALISSGHENSTDWKLNTTAKYLMNYLNSSSVDFLSTYMTLPLLNGKTLADIGKINCSENPRKHGDDPIADLNDYIGPKTRVQYSLYIGDNKDVIHTISLLVPENYTALEVMELAEAEDPKFRFERKVMSSKAYVYEIAGITNDPEIGKFWLLYYSSGKNILTHLNTSLEDLTVEDGSRLAMWYKTARI